ncbi:hypothetical protein NDU88_002261 [Pleurodeles waltl]|uniref:Uncharacterized protein n=1 Tax=Pleurodeles waltl TaxID=8319 RepID=A0AAV7Q5G4_PLEWA|nr:hypothetical protein NDU88_002261 [Pleurodeles waltl]
MATEEGARRDSWNWRSLIMLAAGLQETRPATGFVRGRVRHKAARKLQSGRLCSQRLSPVHIRKFTTRPQSKNGRRLWGSPFIHECNYVSPKALYTVYTDKRNTLLWRGYHDLWNDCPFLSGTLLHLGRAVGLSGLNRILLMMLCSMNAIRDMAEEE